MISGQYLALNIQYSSCLSFNLWQEKNTLMDCDLEKENQVFIKHGYPLILSEMWQHYCC